MLKTEHGNLLGLKKNLARVQVTCSKNPHYKSYPQSNVFVDIDILSSTSELSPLPLFSSSIEA